MGWSVSGLAGVADNGFDPHGNSFNVVNATNANHDGTTSTFGQAAFIQSGQSLGSASISQAIPFAEAGKASVTFSIELRGDIAIGNNPIDVKFDSIDLGSYVARSGSSFNTVTTPTVLLTAGTHTLSFTGTNTLGSDNTQFIDNVQVLFQGLPDLAASVDTDGIVPTTAPDLNLYQMFGDEQLNVPVTVENKGGARRQGM